MRVCVLLPSPREDPVLWVRAPSRELAFQPNPFFEGPTSTYGPVLRSGGEGFNVGLGAAPCRP